MLKFVAESEFTDADRLRVAADKLDRRFMKRLPRQFPRLDGKSLVTIEPEPVKRKKVDCDDKRFFHARRLPDLSCFHIECHPLVEDVQLSTQTIHPERVEDWFDWNSQQSQRIAHVGISTYVVAAGRDVAKARSDIVESCDYALNIYVDAQGSVRIFWTWYGGQTLEPARRREFIETCLRATGLDQAIRIETMPQGFVLRSDVYQVRSPNATWDNYDEAKVKIWMNDAAQAKQWTDQVVVALGAQFVGAAVSLHCRVAEYAEHRTTWNSLGRGWEFFTAAAYPSGFDPFTAPLPIGPDELAYPLLYWEAGPETMYQCDLTAAASGRRLQVITNTSSEKKLRSNIQAADAGLTFETRRLDDA